MVVVCYFNSIKVRLKLNKATISISLQIQFQFHKGTIKTETEPLFNEEQPNFNSIKVRLKRKFKCKRFNKYSFQFHKGTIKTEYQKAMKNAGAISIP